MWEAATYGCGGDRTSQTSGTVKVRGQRRFLYDVKGKRADVCTGKIFDCKIKNKGAAVPYSTAR
jgi:hypothetical protein